jgi:divalent metal cation (Fe/Co/Zn/Cd) transporter
VPQLLALAILIRRRLPSIWSVLIVLAVLVATVVVILHSVTAWITGHPLAVSLFAAAAVGITAVTTATAQRRAR